LQIAGCTRELKQHSDDSVKATDQCDAAEDQLEKSVSGVTAEVEIIEGIDKLFTQNYEQKETTGTPIRVIGGASCPPADLVSHGGPVYDRDHVQSEETDRSENVNKCTAVQITAMKQRELKPPRPLRVSSINGLKIRPEQLIEQQSSDETLKRYWELCDKPAEIGKPQFVTKKGIQYWKCKTESGVECKLQLVVPVGLRERVVALAHDTLFSGHRGAAKTLSRVQQEFYWPGIHNFVTRYGASCDLCQRNVSKGIVGKAPMGKLLLVGTPFSTVCVDIVGPLSPPSDGYTVDTF